MQRPVALHWATRSNRQPPVVRCLPTIDAGGPSSEFRAYVVRTQFMGRDSDGQLNVYAGELEVRPPAAPTTTPYASRRTQPVGQDGLIPIWLRASIEVGIHSRAFHACVQSIKHQALPITNESIIENPRSEMLGESRRVRRGRIAQNDCGKRLRRGRRPERVRRPMPRP